MTQVLLSARLDEVAALIAALATADALRRVELLAAVQYHIGLALRFAVVDAREDHTVREVAGVLGIPHSVLIRQLRGGPVLAKPGRAYYRPDSRNAASNLAELPQAS